MTPVTHTAELEADLEDLEDRLDEIAELAEAALAACSDDAIPIGGTVRMKLEEIVALCSEDDEEEEEQEDLADGEPGP